MPLLNSNKHNGRQILTTNVSTPGVMLCFEAKLTGYVQTCEFQNGQQSHSLVADTERRVPARRARTTWQWLRLSSTNKQCW